MRSGSAFQYTEEFSAVLGSSSTGTSTCTVSSKVCTILPVSVVTRPKILTVPRSTPSLFWKVTSRFLI